MLGLYGKELHEDFLAEAILSDQKTLSRLKLSAVCICSTVARLLHFWSQIVISVAKKTMKTKDKYKEQQKPLLKFGSKNAVIWQPWFAGTFVSPGMEKLESSDKKISLVLNSLVLHESSQDK